MKDFENSFEKILNSQSLTFTEDLNGTFAEINPSMDTLPKFQIYKTPIQHPSECHMCAQFM